MPYTDRKKIKFKKLFKKSSMLDDYKYTRIPLFKPEEVSNNIIFELHLRIEPFEVIYDKCYKFISKEMKKNTLFPFGGYPDLNQYEPDFENFGYTLSEIIAYIFNEISIVNYSVNKSYFNTDLGKYSKVNLYTANLIHATPSKNNAIHFNSKPLSGNIYSTHEDDPYTESYYNFIEKFDRYEYQYSTPSNKFFLEENSININVLLNQTQNANEKQLENILKLINNTKVQKHQYDIQGLVTTKLADISHYFYLYDLAKEGIPVSFISKYTSEYFEKKPKYGLYEDIDRVRNILNSTIELTENINKKIQSFILSDTLTIDEIKQFSSEVEDLVNKYEHVNLYQKRLIHEKMFLFSQDMIDMLTKCKDNLWMLHEEEQVKIAKSNIANDPDKEDYYTNNYRMNEIENIKYNFASFDFSTVNKITNFIRDLEEVVINNHKDTLSVYKKYKAKKIKDETLNKYTKKITASIKIITQNQ